MVPCSKATSKIQKLLPASFSGLHGLHTDNPDTGANYVGIAVAPPATDQFCSAANGGISDVLPDEPNGYSSFNELLGNRSLSTCL